MILNLGNVLANDYIIQIPLVGVIPKDGYILSLYGSTTFYHLFFGHGYIVNTQNLIKVNTKFNYLKD